MNTHIVTRKLSGPNGVIPIGTEIDASDFRNVELLVKQRYLKPLETAPDADFQKQVVAAVMKDIQEGGPLSELLRVPNIQVPAKSQSNQNRK